MEYLLRTHRNGLFLFENDPAFVSDWMAVRHALDSITDEDLIAAHQEARSRRSNCKSLSDAINELLRRGLSGQRWERESAIFSDPEYSRRNETRWRLDFASDVMAVEIAFNHGEAIAWNLLKPVMSAELNHVDKTRQTRAGIIITATEAMKRAGNFDGAVGTYEKFQRYLNPMMNLLTVPMVIVGLEPPRSFAIGSAGAAKGEVIPLAQLSQHGSEILAAEEIGQYGDDAV